MATSTKPPNTDPQRSRIARDASASQRAWQQWTMLGVGAVGAFAIVAIVVSLVALYAKSSERTIIEKPVGAARSTAGTAAPIGSGAAQAGSGAVIPIVLQPGKPTATNGIPGTFTGKPGWPRFAASSITVPAGKKVTLVITNYDDGPTPLPAAERAYNKVSGGTETIDGKPVTFVSNKIIAHTFTIPQLGINVPIAAGPGHGVGATVTFTFVAPKKKGIYLWQCYVPCGTGPQGTGGAMATNGWMRGTMTVD